MFKNLFSRQSTQSTVQAIETAPETNYVEVAGLMDDFISLEEFAPGAEYTDLLAASWGIPCETSTAAERPAVSLKASGNKMFRGFFQASKLEVA